MPTYAALAPLDLGAVGIVCGIIAFAQSTRVSFKLRNHCGNGMAAVAVSQ